ncbi:MarR family winged helix-turn-helix transcriptional regulator [Brucella sp. IR073]|uniref:MarR family winged helix-turn-helix transcriptional regulator n=1 Tax=unclassified Brucella TaxID=2632610 RepID=UPI003B97EED8
MTKERKPVILHRLQSAARLGRTSLATRLLEHGLYAGQDAIMLQLAAEDGLPPGVLAQRLGVRPPTVTKTIARLQSQGFVTKQASERDQRQAHVFLTESGRDVIRVIEKSIRKTEKDALRGLDKRERKTLLKLLSRLEGNLSAPGPVEAEESAESVSDEEFAD